MAHGCDDERISKLGLGGESMSQQAVEIGPILREVYGECLPDSAFEGRHHIWKFDWSIVHTDQAEFMRGINELKGCIGHSEVHLILGQLIYRALDGREAEAAFLQAVFGEVPHAE